MLDSSKYAQYFPDENRQAPAPAAQSEAAPQMMRPSLLAALSELEREFREILQRTQQVEQTDRSE